MTTRVAVLTAAGSGMGADAARRLARDGFAVAILSSSGKGEALARELGGVGVTGSNRSEEDVRRLIDLAVERWGRIDVLVNSAGHGPRGPVAGLTDADWHEGLEIYFLAAVRASRLAAPVMARGGGGSIVNVSTFAAFEPDAEFSDLGGVSGRTRLLREALLGPACGGERPHEQRSAGVHRQPAGEAGPHGAHPARALRPRGGGLGPDLLSGVRRRRIRHGAEFPGGRGTYALRLILGRRQGVEAEPGGLRRGVAEPEIATRIGLRSGVDTMCRNVS